LGELAIIVAGVLIALVVDGWWEEHQEQERALAALRAVQMDLSADSSYIARHFAIYPRQIEMVRQLIEIDLRPGLDPDSLAAIFGEIAKVTPDRWNTAGYQALLGSGDLRLIDDQDLVRALTQYYSHQLPNARNAASSDERLADRMNMDFSALFDPYSVTASELMAGGYYELRTDVALDWAREHQPLLIDRESSLVSLLDEFRFTERSRAAANEEIARVIN
jgi:hypothetical protein